MHNFERPRDIQLLHATCLRTMAELRKQLDEVGVGMMANNKLWISDFISWWKLLEIAIRRLDGAAEVSNEKECKKAIEVLEGYRLVPVSN